MHQHHTTPTTTIAVDWDKLAKRYNSVAGNLTVLHSAEALRLLDLSSSDRLVLDVAAGTGAFALQAAKELRRLHAEQPTAKGAAYKVLATDFAEAMVHACRAEAEQQGLSDIVECKQMDAQDLSEVEDSTVDAFGCAFGAMFFPDVVKGFREMHRVLRPGGRAAIVVWKQVATVSLIEGLAKRIQKELAFNEDQPVDLASRIAYKLADPEHFKDQLKAAGFTDEQIVSMTTFETDWNGVQINDDSLEFMLDNPVVKMCFPSEKRSEAAAILKELLTDPSSPLRRSARDNLSLIALVRK